MRPKGTKISLKPDAVEILQTPFIKRVTLDIVKEVAGIRLCDHIVERGAGLPFAVQYRPIDRSAATILR